MSAVLLQGAGRWPEVGREGLPESASQAAAYSPRAADRPGESICQHGNLADSVPGQQVSFVGSAIWDEQYKYGARSTACPFEEGPDSFMAVQET